MIYAQWQVGFLLGGVAFLLGPAALCASRAFIPKGTIARTGVVGARPLRAGALDGRGRMAEGHYTRPPLLGASEWRHGATPPHGNS